ncbi:MAG: DNA repair exonuclease [Nitrospinota bacterium]|jgi:DNA repair exonuclease SbcCD nuclease subunit|nr:DNA repair exonuclease [Nitrospinota bacterium]
MSDKPSENITFIHTADVHLGRPFDSLGGRGPERREDLRAAFGRMVERAVKEKVDLFLVAGDLFDSPCPPPADREAARAGFLCLREAGVRAFAIPGNHDFFIPGGVWSEMEAAGVTVFSRPQLEGKEVPPAGVRVFGMAYDRERPRSRPLADLQAEGDDAAGARILLFHGSLEVLGEGYDDAPFSEAEISRLPFDYVALGHYHSWREIGQRPLAAYPGSPSGVGMTSRETGERYFLLGRVETNEAERSVHLERIPAGGRTVHVKEIDLSRSAKPEDLFGAVRHAAGPDDLLSLRLTGVPSPEVWEAAGELEDRFEGVFFHFRVDRSGVAALEEIPDDDRFILGRFCNKLQSRLRQTEGEERVVCEMALRLGLAAANPSKPSAQSFSLSAS